jgi:hypothetical protein
MNLRLNLIRNNKMEFVSLYQWNFKRQNQWEISWLQHSNLSPKLKEIRYSRTEFNSLLYARSFQHQNLLLIIVFMEKKILLYYPCFYSVCMSARIESLTPSCVANKLNSSYQYTSWNGFTLTLEEECQCHLWQISSLAKLERTITIKKYREYRLGGYYKRSGRKLIYDLVIMIMKDWFKHL